MVLALPSVFRFNVTTHFNGCSNIGLVQWRRASFNPLFHIAETRRLLQEVENIKRRGRREAASLRDEEERYNNKRDVSGEKENRERIAPKPQNPTGSTAEDVSTLSSWSRPPTSSMGAEASAGAGAGGAKQKRKKRSRDGIFDLSSRHTHDIREKMVLRSRIFFIKYD